MQEKQPVPWYMWVLIAIFAIVWTVVVYGMGVEY